MSSAKKVMFEKQPSTDAGEDRNFLEILLKKVDEEKSEVRTALKTIDSQQQKPNKEKEFVNYGSQKFSRKKRAASKKRNGKNNDDSSDDGFAANDDMPINVSLKDPKRFDVYSAQKEARLEKLRRDYQEAELQHLKSKPKISPYNFTKERVPVHQRDFNKEAESKQKLLEEIKRQNGKNQYEDCTFSPDLRKSAGEDSLERDRGKTVEELLEWKRERDGRMALLRMETVDKDANECTFKPKLNSKSKQIMSHYEPGTMPIKQSKKEFIEEFLKREKTDNFKPRINSKTYEILQKGYKPSTAQVKTLKPAYLHKQEENQQRHQSKNRNSRSASKSIKHQKSITEQEIIERFRTEAHPNKPKKRLGLVNRRPVSSSKNFSGSARKAAGSPAPDRFSRNKSSSAFKIPASNKSDNRRSVDLLQTRPLGNSLARIKLTTKIEFDKANRVFKQDPRQPETSRSARQPRPAENSSPSHTPDKKQANPTVSFSARQLPAAKSTDKNQLHRRSTSKESIEARERVKQNRERTAEHNRRKIEHLFYKDGSLSPPRSRPSGSPKPQKSASSRRIK